jgi:hypothetical protein
VVGGESDQHGVVAVTLAHQLADVQFAACAAHFGGARVAQVRVVRPDDHAGGGTAPRQVRHQRLEGLDHVTVAQVPRGHVAQEHRPVVSLCVRHQPRILLGMKRLVDGDQAVALDVVHRSGAQRAELRHRRFGAGRRSTQAGEEAIVLRVGAEAIEAGIALARRLGRGGIRIVEEAQHRVHRRVQAVQVEAVEPRACARRERVVVRAQPLDEIDDVGVAPHPRREAAEVAERRRSARLGAHAANMAIDAIGVRPVRLDCHCREALLDDQPLRDRRAQPVELVRAVRRLAQQHVVRIADQVEQRVEVARLVAQRLRELAQPVGEVR